MYKYYQPNKKDLKDNHGDCVIRALTMIMDKSWLGVFDDLIPYARELQDDFSCSLHIPSGVLTCPDGKCRVRTGKF